MSALILPAPLRGQQQAGGPVSRFAPAAPRAEPAGGGSPGFSEDPSGHWSETRVEPGPLHGLNRNSHLSPGRLRGSTAAVPPPLGSSKSPCKTRRLLPAPWCPGADNAASSARSALARPPRRPLPPRAPRRRAATPRGPGAARRAPRGPAPRPRPPGPAPRPRPEAPRAPGAAVTQPGPAPPAAAPTLRARGRLAAARSPATFAPAQDPAAQALQQDVGRLLVRGGHPLPGLPAPAPRAPGSPTG